MIYLRALSLARTSQPQVIGRLISNEFENMCKNAGMAFFETLSRTLLGGTERNHEKSQIRMAGLWPDI